MKIVVDDKIPFLKGVLEPFAEVKYLPGAEITHGDLEGVDALLIRTRTKCGARLLEGTGVRFIASATIGSDHIDFNYCRANGIKAVTAPGCNAQSVAQYVSSVLLCDAAKNSIDLKGKALGIIGCGHVGSCVSVLGGILGMRVLISDPPRERIEGSACFVPLKTILAESDYVTLHTPLTTEGADRTFHLANEDFFLSLAKRPFFINASRGEVTDTASLKGAIITKRVRSCAIDVWEDEPDINEELLHLVTYATPHIAGYSADGKANGTSAVVRELAAFFNIEELKNFFPTDVPAPVKPLILLPSDKSALQDAVTAAYNVLDDDARLKASPDSFEKLRGDYPLRREPCAYTIDPASKITPQTLRTLVKLGFNPPPAPAR